MNHLMYWVILGVIILNLLGFFIDVAWIKEVGKLGYFSYNIKVLGDFPYWLFATISYITISGVASLYFAGVRFHVSAKQGDYQGGFPLPPIKLLGINLLLIPSLLILFILIRAIGL